MISRLNMHHRVSTLVTLSTPHAGTTYADFALRNLSRTGILRLFTRLGLDLTGVKDLTPSSAQRFNEQTPDSPEVTYYSISASQPWHKIPTFLLPSWRVIHQVEGPNDGLVSVQSSSSHGTPLPPWPADHWHLVNRHLTLTPRQHNILPRYLTLLKNLLPSPVQS
jgi:triacylglycerol lipase